MRTLTSKQKKYLENHKSMINVLKECSERSRQEIRLPIEYYRELAEMNDTEILSQEIARYIEEMNLADVVMYISKITDDKADIMFHCDDGDAMRFILPLKSLFEGGFEDLLRENSVTISDFNDYLAEHSEILGRHFKASFSMEAAYDNAIFMEMREFRQSHKKESRIDAAVCKGAARYIADGLAFEKQVPIAKSEKIEMEIC